MLIEVLLVFVFGAIGTLLRALIQLSWQSEVWPAATFTINMTGSFALGFLVGALASRRIADHLSRRIKVGLGTGLLGGYTTYSAFIIEGESLASTNLTSGLLYLVGSVVLGVALAGFGTFLAKRIFTRDKALK